MISLKKFFLFIYPKISTFLGKLLYFRITLKKSFLFIRKYQYFEKKYVIFRSVLKTRFQPLSPKVSRFFGGYCEKVVFWCISLEISIFREKNKTFLNHFEKVVFWPYQRNYQHFGENRVIFKSFRRNRFFVQKSVNIIIFRQ